MLGELGAGALRSLLAEIEGHKGSLLYAARQAYLKESVRTGDTGWLDDPSLEDARTRTDKEVWFALGVRFALMRDIMSLDGIKQAAEMRLRKLERETR